MQHIYGQYVIGLTATYPDQLESLEGTHMKRYTPIQSGLPDIQNDAIETVEDLEGFLQKANGHPKLIYGDQATQDQLIAMGYEPRVDIRDVDELQTLHIEDIYLVKDPELMRSFDYGT